MTRARRLAGLVAGILSAGAALAIRAPATEVLATGGSGAPPGVGAAGPPSPACAQLCRECEPGPGDVPDLSCIAESLSCRTQRTLCEAKLAAYRAQMDQLGAGVELSSLPTAYLRILAPFYPRLDLATVRFGVSPRQPPDNAITDCDRIYFARSEFVERLRLGELRATTDWLWLLHELRHAEQCASLGGRDAYAVRWLDELGLSFLSDADLATLHDRIPMEGDADRRAEIVLAELSACCRAPDGQLRSPASPGVAAPPPGRRNRAGPP